MRSAAPDKTDVAADVLRAAGEATRIVFVSGNFNTVHPGHLRLLRFATELGDYLVVGVNDDHTAGVFVAEDLRLEGVKSIGLVKVAFILREPADVFIRRLKPAIVVMGKEHEGRSHAEQAAVDSYGGKLCFSSGETQFSSFDLLQREMREANLSSIVRPRDFLVRHGFTMPDLRSIMQQMKGLRVTVLGDLIVDEYVTCDPLGMSQEDPTLVVTPVQQERFVGGAGIVAAHARELGAEVTYFGVAGNDPAAGFARTKLAEYDVKTFVLEDDTRPTTLKQRFRAGGRTLLRVSHLRQHEISQALVKQYVAGVKACLTESDLLIFSDFNYGCLPQPVVDRVVGACRRRNIPMAADSQSSSQMGDVSRFKDMLLVTPTEREARLAVRDFKSGLVVLIEKLRKKSGARNVLLTLGAEGLIAHAAQDTNGEWLTDRLPALNTAPKDSAGAGDCLLTCAAMALTAGATLWESSYLGSIAAACQVARVGNIPLSARDIEIELSN